MVQTDDRIAARNGRLDNGFQPETYTDRYGRTRLPGPGDVFRERTGVFAAIVSNGDRVLVTWPKNAPASAELPGGGVEPGENLREALVREIYEETGLTFPSGIREGDMHSQRAHFFAEDLCEFWAYEQTFYLFRLDADQSRSLVFEGLQETPDGGFSAWRSLEEIAAAEFQAIHRRVLARWLPEVNSCSEA